MFSRTQLIKVQAWIFALLVFLWPTNLFVKFAENSAYVHGLLVDYLLPKIFVSDILIVVLLACWSAELLLQKKNIVQPLTIVRCAVAFSLLLLVAMAQIISPKPIASFWFLAKIVEMGILGLWLSSHRKLFQQKSVVTALILMLTFQSVVGLGQFFTQSSVFPSYQWFGETRLEQRAGLARGVFDNTEKILPYGTTSHPNVLAGVLAVGCLSLWFSVKSQRKVEKSRLVMVIIASTASLVTLLLTQSWSAWMALGLGTTLLKTSTWLTKRPGLIRSLVIVGGGTFVCMPFAINLLAQASPLPSFSRRDLLNQAAFKMWQQHPLTGVGLNSFTAELENVLPNTEVVRFVQPAHHVGLLFLAETGILGIIVLSVLILLLKQRSFKFKRVVQNFGILLLVAVFLPLASLDHYLWTQQIGQLTLVIGSLWLFTTQEKD